MKSGRLSGAAAYARRSGPPSESRWIGGPSRRSLEGTYRANGSDKRRGRAFLRPALHRYSIQSAAKGGDGLGRKVPERRAAALLRAVARVSAQRTGGPQGPGVGRAEGPDVRRPGRGGGQGSGAQRSAPRRRGLRLPVQRGKAAPQ